MIRNHLTQRYPVLYHMAEAGSWQSIQRHGLLSAEALVDLFQVPSPRRNRLLSQRRPRKVPLNHDVHGLALLRDQKPLTDAGLARSLSDGMEPRDWYELINGLVFAWATRDRLEKFRRAAAYRHERKLILMLDTASLLSVHTDRLLLSAMNSGATRPFAHPRGRETFQPPATFPYNERLERHQEPVAEFAFQYSIPDIEQYVVDAVEIDGGEELAKLISTRKRRFRE